MAIYAHDSEKFERRVRYGFSFVSIISPHLANNVRLLYASDLISKKALIKQSYMLLIWFYYLSFLELSRDNKHRLKIFVLPVKRKTFTLTKAPMAHKTNSKEQYKFQFYKFKVTFPSFFKEDNAVNSLNAGLLFVLISKKIFPQFETNLLFLKTYTFTFLLSDGTYFNYCRFVS